MCVCVCVKELKFRLFSFITKTRRIFLEMVNVILITASLLQLPVQVPLLFMKVFLSGALSLQPFIILQGDGMYSFSSRHAC